MLKIVRFETARGTVTFKLDGDVAGPWVDELGRSCARVLHDGARLTLDAAGVTFVDREGVRLLEGLLAGGVALLNRPAFLTEQLNAIRARGLPRPA